VIRHIALFRFSDAVTAEDIVDLDAALGKLPALVSTITSFDCGMNLGITGGAWDYAVVADFASQADYSIYATNPDHLDIVNTVVKPMITDAARIQFEV